MSKCLVLKNIASATDLEQNYNDIYDDIEQELQKFGKLESLLIIWPVEIKNIQDLGCAYVMFEDVGSSLCAYNLLADKIFNERKIGVEFIKEEWFNKLKD